MIRTDIGLGVATAMIVGAVLLGQSTPSPDPGPPSEGGKVAAFVAANDGRGTVIRVEQAADVYLVTVRGERTGDEHRVVLPQHHGIHPRVGGVALLEADTPASYSFLRIRAVK